MRHYEVVFFAHPSQSEQIPSMIDRYKEMVTTSGGTVHRVEDWGRKKLAYPINKLHKAHYVLFNIECDQETIANLRNNFRFNDIVLRFLVMAKKTAETGESAMLIATREEKEQEEKTRNRFVSKERADSRSGAKATTAAEAEAPEQPAEEAALEPVEDNAPAPATATKTKTKTETETETETETVTAAGNEEGED